MRTSIVLDEKLVLRVMKLAGVKTKSEDVRVALQAFVRANSRPDVRRRYGIGGGGTAYDYMKLRAV